MCQENSYFDKKKERKDKKNKIDKKNKKQKTLHIHYEIV